MPRISTHAIPLATVQQASRPMIDALVALLGTAREHFSIEVQAHPFVLDGELVQGRPFVELALFDRGAEAERKAVELITAHLQAAGVAEVDVYLRRLERCCYFANGRPL